MAPARIRPVLAAALLALCVALSEASAQAKPSTRGVHPSHNAPRTTRVTVDYRDDEDDGKEDIELEGDEEWFKRGSHPKGPCSPVTSNITIPIKTAADFQKRTQQSRNQTVVLMLQNSLLLSKGSGLLFDGAFSCTILTAAKPNLYIKYSTDDMPTLRIWNTSNLLVYGINFLVTVTTGSPQCPNIPEVGTGVNCPAVHISRSYGIIFGKSTVFGRVDVHRSMNSRVDSIKVTGTPTFASSHGVIRVAYSGHSTKLIKANVVISNNEAYGVDTPIVLYRGAVGVKVYRNYVHDFIFAGIRCGADVHFAGDCMMTNVSNNLVIAKGRNTNGDHDAAGIYYCTHWFNPGNVAQCNYVFNGDHCYYLDYDTSDVRIRGGACVNTYDGIKVNNGKRNVIKDVVMKGQIGAVGWCTCLTPTVNNCLKDPGLYWENMRKAYYDTPTFRKYWPWWKNVCQESAVNGQNCNPKGGMTAAQTGKCSGLATENQLDLILVNTSRDSLEYKYCETLPAMHKLNKHSHVTVGYVPSAGFRNYKRNDLGLKLWSDIRLKRPTFLSCPRRTTGPQKKINAAWYLRRFNIVKPNGFDAVLTMTTQHLMDQSQIPK
ncbi:hypothetical protein CLOM_g1574 [Closterium sp. NIES-68]|nr:hypothetical protein CLOM_g1574 [Closterium sp. NIES-68]GJP85975.1 hypothetical protein CLOP_g16057 [Closterium sp. NIES-67]